MTEQTTAAAEEQAPVQLSLNDLGGAVQVIDICTKRGAFEGPELEQVGALRNRLVAFLQANAPAEEGEGETAPEADQAPE